MFVVWSGWGILTILVVGGVTAVVTGILQALATAAGYPDLQLLWVAMGLFAAAAANWFFGRWMNSGTPRELIDPQTGQRVLLHRLHKLFWIRMEWWSIPVAIFGLFMLIGQVAGGGKTRTEVSAPFAGASANTI